MKLEEGMRFEFVYDYGKCILSEPFEKGTILEIVDVKRLSAFNEVVCDVYSEEGEYIRQQFFANRFFEMNLSRNELRKIPSTKRK